MKRWGRLAIGVIAGALMAAPPAWAQNADLLTLLNRLDRLERDIRTLNIQVSRGVSGGEAAQAAQAAQPLAPPPSGGVDNVGLARLSVRITSLEEEVRSATGQMEDLAHRIEQVGGKLEKLQGDIDYRFSALEKKTQAMAAQPRPAGSPQGVSAAALNQGMPPSGALGSKPGVLGAISQSDLDEIERRQAAHPPLPEEQPQTASVAPDGVLPKGAPEEQYAYAFGLLRQTRYDEAEAALEAFIIQNPDSSLTPNARYWLGETYYVRGEYLTAASAFLEGYQKAPKGGKAPDTLLKLGMSLSHLGKKPEACAALGRLRKEFPNASAVIKSTVDRERKKNECR